MAVALVCIAMTLVPLARTNGTAGGERARLTPALVIVTGGAAVTFVAYIAYVLRCRGSGCHDTGWTLFGVLGTWWRREAAWEWGAQLALASAGLVSGSIALALSARGRQQTARPPLIAARVAYLAWAVLVFLPAAAYEVFVR